MGNTNKKPSSFTKFMSGRGFYLALAVCLIGTGTAAWVAVDRTLGSISESNSKILQNESAPSSEPNWAFGDTEGVGKGQSGVNVSSAPSSSGPISSASSTLSAKPQPPSASSTPPAASPGSAFMLPITGEIFAPYSNGKLVQDPTLKEWRTHNGIDIRAAKGATIVAVADGTISAVYNDPLWGWTVEITHTGGLTSIYCGLAKDVPVKAGQGIKLNQQVGSVGDLPAEVSLGEHFHFGMKKDGKWCDPLVTMGKVK